MQHERDEQVIFIKDLIFTALYQWRKILIAAVAFALLLGGYKAASGLPLATATTPEDSTEVAALKEKVQWQQTYMEASVVMNLNPYEIYKATLTVSVMAENITVDGSTQPVSHIGALLKSYAASLSAAMITQEAADLAGWLETPLTIPGHYDMFAGNTEDPLLFTEYMRVKYPALKTEMLSPGEVRLLTLR